MKWIMCLTPYAACPAMTTDQMHEQWRRIR